MDKEYLKQLQDRNRHSLSKIDVFEKKVVLDTHKCLAIMNFVTSLGLIPKDRWRFNVQMQYSLQALEVQPDGSTKGPFNTGKEYLDFINAVVAQNGGRFPIVDNFWFSFIGRIVIWGLITIAITKLLGFFAVVIGMVIALSLHFLIFPTLRRQKIVRLIRAFETTYQNGIRRGTPRNEALREALQCLLLLPGVPLYENLTDEDVEMIVRVLSNRQEPNRLVVAIMSFKNTRQAVQSLKDENFLKQAVERYKL
jgi:hypothetical protein